MIRARHNPERGMARGRMLIILLVVALLSIGGWIGFNLYSGQSRQETVDASRMTADNFVSLLANKNADTTYESLSKAHKDTMPRDTWKEWVEIAFGNVEGKPSFVREFPIQQAGDIYGKDTTPVRYVYSFTINGKPYKVPFVFIKEDETWKLAEVGSPLE